MSPEEPVSSISTIVTEDVTSFNLVYTSEGDPVKTDETRAQTIYDAVKTETVFTSSSGAVLFNLDFFKTTHGKKRMAFITYDYSVSYDL